VSPSFPAPREGVVTLMAIWIVRPSFGVCQSSGTVSLAHLVRGGRSSPAGQVTYASFGVNVALTMGAAAELAGSRPRPRAITAVMANEGMMIKRWRVIVIPLLEGKRALFVHRTPCLEL
jgi:hypothetical protein